MCIQMILTPDVYCCLGVKVGEGRVRRAGMSVCVVFLFHMAIIVEGMGECSSFWAWEGKKEFASIDHALQENPCY